MKQFIKHSIGRKNRSAIGLMHNNYPYSERNIERWLHFPKEVTPLLSASYNDIENSILITIEEEDNHE